LRGLYFFPSKITIFIRWGFSSLYFFVISIRIQIFIIDIIRLIKLFFFILIIFFTRDNKLFSSLFWRFLKKFFGSLFNIRLSFTGSGFYRRSGLSPGPNFGNFTLPTLTPSLFSYLFIITLFEWLTIVISSKL
jgi:hypothetical protein